MGASQADVRAVDNSISENVTSPATFYGSEFFAATDQETAAPGLSLFDRFKLAITPESYGEGIVNEIYGPELRGLKADPSYDINDLSSPNVYVKAKQTASEVTTMLGGIFKGGLFTAAAFVLVAIAVYAAVGAFVRR